MKLQIVPSLIGCLISTQILFSTQTCDAKNRSEQSLFDRVEKLIGPKPTKVVLKYPKLSLKDSTKGSDHSKVAGYRIKISNYSDLEKIRKVFVNTDYSVFICNLDKWEQKNKTKLFGGKNKSVHDKNESYQVLILKSVKPSDIIRLVSGPNIAEYGINSENVAQKVKQWCGNYNVRIDSVNSHGVDLEFMQLPRDLNGFMKELEEFDPNLFATADATNTERKKRFKDMVAYFKRTKILTLSWE